jgi:predicted DNA-binding transcriptional regulator YafY
LRAEIVRKKWHPVGMSGPTGRALALLSLLQTHRFWSGAELAERLEVSERTLRRDVDRLRSFGYPVDATTGKAGGYRLAAGAHLPPLLLDDDEAVAISVGLRSTAMATIDGMGDTSARALAKLEQVLPDRLRRRVRAVHSSITPVRWNERGAAGPTVDPEALAVLGEACRDHVEVRFDYRSREGEETSRLVEPHQLVTAGRRWYLVAYDLRRDDWRSFRVDRLTEPRLAGKRFTPRPIPEGDAGAYVARSLGSQPVAFSVGATVHLSAADARAAMRWIDVEVDEIDAVSCRAVFRAESADALAGSIVISALAADIELDRADLPAEVRTSLATAAARLSHL